VAVHAQIDNKLFGGSTNADVVVGRDGWLYAADEFAPPCRYTAAQLLTQMDQAAAAFAAAGHPIRFVVAPDKRAIYPEEVRDGLPYPEACTTVQRPAMRAGFAARPSITTDFWGPVAAERSSSPDDPIYWRTDTHWNDVGALQGVRALVQAEAPGVWDEAAVKVVGTARREGDLSRLIGLPTEEVSPRVVIDRAGELRRTILDAGVVTTPGREVLRYTVTGNAAVVPGRTLIVYDSSFGVHADLIAPWFAESVWLHVNELIEHPQIVKGLPAFDRVIFERVERLSYSRDLVATLKPLLR
jgi:hypothetical protein